MISTRPFLNTPTLTEKPNRRNQRRSRQPRKPLHILPFSTNPTYQEYVVPRSIPTTVPTSSFLSSSSGRAAPSISSSTAATREGFILPGPSSTHSAGRQGFAGKPATGRNTRAHRGARAEDDKPGVRRSSVQGEGQVRNCRPRYLPLTRTKTPIRRACESSVSVDRAVAYSAYITSLQPRRGGCRLAKALLVGGR